MKKEDIPYLRLIEKEHKISEDCDTEEFGNYKGFMGLLDRKGLSPEHIIDISSHPVALTQG